MKLKITNGHIITPFRYIRNGTLLVQDGMILGIHEGNVDFPDAEIIDAGGNYIAPGFIDLHIHGGGGYDFMDGTAHGFLRIAETHAKYGTTSMVPTTLTSEKEDLLQTLDNYEEANATNLKGAQFLGMHLEGPYFALSQRGAQDPRYIRNPDPKEYEEVLEAYENGYTLATHLYSAMSGVTRKNAFRYAGTIESAFLLDMDVEIIADGVHLPAPLLKLIYKIKGPDRIALITDAMRAAGMPEGESTLGSLKNGLKVIVEDGVAKLPDRTSFAGSVSTTDRLVRNMVQMADVSLLDSVRMMTATPARIMGVDHKKGTLVAGKDADIVIFDNDINIQKTIVRGRVIYDKQF